MGEEGRGSGSAVAGEGGREQWRRMGVGRYTLQSGVTESNGIFQRPPSLLPGEQMTGDLLK